MESNNMGVDKWRYHTNQLQPTAFLLASFCFADKCAKKESTLQWSIFQTFHNRLIEKKWKSIYCEDYLWAHHKKDNETKCHFPFLPNYTADSVFFAVSLMLFLFIFLFLELMLQYYMHIKERTVFLIILELLVRTVVVLLAVVTKTGAVEILVIKNDMASSILNHRSEPNIAWNKPKTDTVVKNWFWLLIVSLVSVYLSVYGTHRFY